MVGSPPENKDDDLPARFERNCPVEDRLCVLKRRFVHVTDLICIHKARIAHHVAAVCQIDGQHRSAAKFNVARSVMMNVLVLSRLKIAAVKERFDALEKRRVGRHHIDKFAVRRAGLFHHDLAVFLDDLCLDLARVRIHQDLERDVDLLITPSRTCLTHVGQSESVSRGNPSGGAVRS